MSFKDYDSSTSSITPTQLLPAYFVVFSEDSIAVNNDSSNPSFFSNISIGNSRDFSLADSVTGAVRNDSGRSISMYGSMSMSPNKGGGGVTTLHLISERSDDGVTWTLNDRSLRIIEVSNNNESFETFASFVVDLEPGQWLRFRAYRAGGSALSFSPTVDTILGQPVTGPSFIWELEEKL